MSLWQQCVDLGSDSAPKNILFKASAVPTEMRHVYADLLRSAEPLEGEAGIVADPLNGSLRCGIRSADGQNHGSSVQTSTLAQLLSFLQNARAVSQEHGGSLVLQRGSLAVKTAFDVWGPDPQGLGVMHSLKRTFDPRHILNPGRFVGEI